MADLQVPAAPVLATVPGVELMRAGTWALSNGIFTFTADDLAQAVAALSCPAVRRPIIKIGHTDPRFDGEPAVGWVNNMAIADNGNTLVGDYAGVPAWLADVMASAYPDRSIEGRYNLVCQVGHTHPFVIEAVALLGVMPPGIGNLQSLQDVAALYGVAAARAATGAPFTLQLAAKGPAMPTRPSTVAAAVNVEDVRRAYYEAASWSMWITEIQLNPLQLIVCDDEDGDMYRVPITVTAAGFAFGAPVEVEVQYIDVPGGEDDDGPMAGAPGRVRYATRAESRPGQRPRAADPQTPATEPEVPATEGVEPVALDLDGLRSQLGLPADADDAALQEALNARLAAPPPTPAPAALPDGVVTVEASVLAELRQGAQAGAAARAQQQQERRDNTIEAAVRAGKITPARREHWRKLWDADTEGAEQALAGLAPGLVPVDAAKGIVGGEDDATSEDATYRSLFGDEKKAGA